jgi:hypothetical protein
MFNLSRLLNTDTGRIFISILLGLGLAALFRGKCIDRKCIKFKGPVIDQITGKIYKFNDSECSKFKLIPVHRDDSKKIVDLPINSHTGTNTSGTESNVEPISSNGTDATEEEYTEPFTDAQTRVFKSVVKHALHPQGNRRLSTLSGTPFTAPTTTNS